MEDIVSLWTVAVISLIAVISPGPDFFLVLKNSLSYSRRIGMITSIGIAVALSIHITYTILGIGSLMEEGSIFYYLLKYLGASYLFYIGLKSFTSSFKKQKEMKQAETQSSISNFIAFRQGFLTNLLNPKCALFFMSFFAQLIDPETTALTKLSYGLINWSISLSWFILLSYLVTGGFLVSRLDRYRIYLDRIMGILLMLLALKLFL